MRLIFFIVALQILSVKAQIDPRTNAPFVPLSVPAIETSNSESAEWSAGIDCDTNTFFAIVGNGTIQKFALASGSVTLLNTSQPTGSNSLAFTNAIASSTFSPTYYSGVNGAGQYNGVGWQSILFGNYLNFGAGGGKHLYLQEGVSVSPYKIVHYDGAQITQIYFSNAKSQGVADLAVDPFGNVYFMISSSLPMTDSLYVISPAGQIIQQLPFSFDFTNAYGSFFLNGSLYIGFGSSHPLHPNSLLPITITGNTVVVGNPISMPATNFFDLASCVQAKQDLTDLQIQKPVGDFVIYPQPAEENFVIDFKRPGLRNLKITSSFGKQILEMKTSESTINLSVEGWEPGIYIIEVLDTATGESFRQKLFVN